MTLEKPATLADVAARAGVDISIASRALSGDPTLRAQESTKQRVLDAARAIGYRPNFAARALRGASARAYGLILPDYEQPAYAELIAGAEEEARSRGSALLVVGSLEGATIRGRLEGLGNGRVDGVLVLAGDSLTHDIRGPAEALPLPCIQLNSRSSHFNRSIVFDDSRAAEVAVTHLVELGHSRIAHVGGAARTYTGGRITLGYRRALMHADLEPVPELELAADATASEGAAVAQKVLRGRRRPTAFFVTHPAAAVGVRHAAVESGLRVPEDVSIITLQGGADLPKFVHPGFTAVRLPFAEMGRRAVRLLATVEGDEAISETIKGPFELAERGTTGPVRRSR